MEKTGLIQLARRFLPRQIKPRRILGGPLRGRYLVTSWYDYPAGLGGYTEASLLKWFEANVTPGECWLDVGAHYGYTALALSGLVGDRGCVWAFEPIPETAGHLVRTAQLNRLERLHVIPVALGEPESVTLGWFGAVRGMAEIGRPITDCPAALLVARLDWLWPRLSAPIARINGIKIDVQGMELQVLRGMSDILRAQRPLVVVELHSGVDRGDVLHALLAAGYSGKGRPIDPSEIEGDPRYADNCSYAFFPDL
jgi:FkbM family methyltransferase